MVMFTAGYSLKYDYWQSVVIARKVIVAFIASFFRDPAVQVHILIER
jgi:hypothetical protein